MSSSRLHGITCKQRKAQFAGGFAISMRAHDVANGVACLLDVSSMKLPPHAFSVCLAPPTCPSSARRWHFGVCDVRPFLWPPGMCRSCTSCSMYDTLPFSISKLTGLTYLYVPSSRKKDLLAPLGPHLQSPHERPACMAGPQCRRSSSSGDYCLRALVMMPLTQGPRASFPLLW